MEFKQEPGYGDFLKEVGRKHCRSLEGPNAEHTISRWLPPSIKQRSY
ncbi:MAG: hypothetical protein QXI59_01265 [Candidatus Bathyarchaeia archaeon]